MTNQLFSITKVANIEGAAKVNGFKPFYAMEFTAGSKKMVLSYTEKHGAKLFWKIDSRIKEVSKNEVHAWLKKYQGADAKKVAGYLNKMEPIARGPVVSTCSVCGRGIDQKIVDWCAQKHEGVHLCFTCQKGKKAPSEARGHQANHRKTASVASGSLGGVPIFKVAELRSWKEKSLDALAAQIVKAIGKHHDDQVMVDKLVRYAKTIQLLISNTAMDEAKQQPADQREAGVAITDGVKEGSESNPAESTLSIEKEQQNDVNYESLKKEQLIAELLRRGIESKGLKRMRKAELISMLNRRESTELAVTVIENDEVILTGDGVAPF